MIYRGLGGWKQTNQRGGPHCCEICCAPPPHCWARQTPAWQRCIPSSPAPPQQFSSSLLDITGKPGSPECKKKNTFPCAHQSEKFPKSDYRKLRGRFLVYILQLRINKTLSRVHNRRRMSAVAGDIQIPSYGSLFIHNQLVMTRPTLQLYSGKDNKLDALVTNALEVRTLVPAAP